MSEYLMYMILNIIDKNESIATLFKLGYSYSETVQLFDDLEDKEYIYTDDEIKHGITQKGKNKLAELEKKYKQKKIAKLEQYKIEQLSLDEIYLP